MHFNAKGGWVGMPVSLYRRSMECKLPFICKYSVNLEFHLTALLWRAGNMRLQSKMTSIGITIQFLNGWTKPNILYIPLIILKFTYNRCNKVKIYKVSFIDYMLIIMFSESISTFPGTSLRNFRIWNTNLFCLTR